MKKNLTEVIKNSTIDYAGAVLKGRALVDARDFLKPSARQIMYSMYRRKFTYNKPLSKTLDIVGGAMSDAYVHGDASCTGIVMRMSQPFAMRYPLMETKGNCGTPVSSDNYAAARYTSVRLNPLGVYLFEGVEKNTKEWYDNYSDTLKLPSTVPSKGFYNVVNGTSGIGYGMGSSCPQYNLREVNAALVKLLDNPSATYEELYCAPDFATGSILLNEKEVKESMRIGQGAACKLRSKVEWDAKRRCFVITELPYSVYTDTVCKQLEVATEERPELGIERVLDLTGQTALIEIYLSKSANPANVLTFLYKETSIEYHYAINFIFLENGKRPRRYGWVEMLQEFLAHQIKVYRNELEFELEKCKKREHILKALLICIDNIEDIIQIIKTNSSALAANALSKKYGFDDSQIKAILDMRLSTLASLNTKKLRDEQNELLARIEEILFILEDENKLKKIIKKDLEDVAKKFGDERRTKLLSNDESIKVIETKDILINISNLGTVYSAPTTTLSRQKRGGVGSKMRLSKGEYIVFSEVVKNTDKLTIFTKNGKYSSFAAQDIDGGASISQVCNIGFDDKIAAVLPQSKNNYVLFITKKGYIKKSEASLYAKSSKSIFSAINLQDDDEVIKVLGANNEPIAITTTNGLCSVFSTEDINPIGINTRGVTAVKLKNDEEVVDACLYTNDTEFFFFISSEGLGKKVKPTEFTVTRRNARGVRISDDGKPRYITNINVKNKDIIIVTTQTTLKVDIGSVNELGRTTNGVKLIAPKNQIVQVFAS